MKLIKYVVLAISLSMVTKGHGKELKLDPRCGNNEKAQRLATLIMGDARQQRTEIRCNKVLTQAAEAKAKLMQKKGIVRHNLGGGPNSWLRDYGYELPDYYGRVLSNQVEAIAGGYETPESVWRGFKKSKGHREHLLGEFPFYQEQDELGVAFIREWHSPHVEYWVVYLTKGFKPNQGNPFEGETIPNKGDIVIQPETPSEVEID